MKKLYTKPEFEVYTIEDMIVTSVGVETSVQQLTVETPPVEFNVQN